MQGLLEATGKKTVKAAANEVGKANRKKRGFLRYDSCSDEDFDAFTYFRDREENDAFLEMINAKKNAEDDGVHAALALLLGEEGRAAWWCQAEAQVWRGAEAGAALEG